MDSPLALGLPQTAWRDKQLSTILSIADGFEHHQHQMLVAPTGFGKSLTYIALQRLLGCKTVVLTATKALQDQLAAEFALSTSLTDLRGQSNYLCNLGQKDLGHPGLEFPNVTPDLVRTVRPGTSVQQAPCKFGIKCPMRDGGCNYYDLVRHARGNPLVVTNYDCWFHSGKWLGERTLLIMDEAHQAPNELADFLSFSLTKDVRRYFAGNMPDGDEVHIWVDWAKWAHAIIKEKMEYMGSRTPPDMVDLERHLRGMTDYLGLGEWVVEHFPDGKVGFDCINPAEFGPRLLFGAVTNTLLVSATVNLETAAQLGLKKTEVRKHEVDSSFPVSRRPVYIFSSAPQINFRMPDADKIRWANLVDRISGPRADRKGIVHTTSFERAGWVDRWSRLERNRLYIGRSGTSPQTIRNYRQAGPGALLVSPSVTTGYDFPGRECEYQILGKIPFPDLRTKAAKIKASRNPQWAGYMAAQSLVQASGRGMRYEEDQCETFCIDGNFAWWLRKNRQFCPSWWLKALVWWDNPATLPVPPKPLPATLTEEEDDVPF